MCNMALNSPIRGAVISIIINVAVVFTTHNALQSVYLNQQLWSLSILAGRKKNGFGQFKWNLGPKPRRHFSATTFQIPALWPTGAGELLKRL